MPVHLRTEAQKHLTNRTVGTVQDNSTDYEFIIINDGSLVDADYLRKYADVYIEHKTSMGVAPTWNDGIKISRGEYVVVINDDIAVPSGWLQDIALCFKTDMCGVASPRVEHLPDFESGISEKITWYPGSCFMLRQDVISNVGLFDERFLPFNCEDVDYWHRLRLKGYKMMRNFDVYVEHAEGSTVKTLDYDEVNYENVKRLTEKWDEDIRKYYYD